MSAQPGAPTQPGAEAQFSGEAREPAPLDWLLSEERIDPKAPLQRGGSPNEAGFWVSQGLSLVNSGDYSAGAEAYQKAAKLYLERGFDDQAAVARMHAFRYTDTLRVFYSQSTDPAQVSRYSTGKRLEPLYGTYVGAYIEGESDLPLLQDQTGRIYRDSKAFNQMVGKKHALFLTYVRYGTDFPVGWFKKLKEAGAGAVLAVEPNDLSAVRDDEMLREFARDLANSGIPVFVRFGSEMNGKWTPWHGDPELYKQKFQLVARVLHQASPRIAMVWCPNDIPEAKIPAYYPGRDAVDWVGVNFYSTYFQNNDSKLPIPWRNPADKLDFVYERYSRDHPIMIGETGAAYEHTCDGVQRTGYAQDKISQLYTALPRRYPRVKAVNYFSFDSIRSNAHRRLYNYSLVKNEAVRSHYERMIHSNYFLSSVQTGTGSPQYSTTHFAELRDGTALSGSVPISSYVKTRVERPTVSYKVDGTFVKQFSDGGPNAFGLRTTALSNGTHTLEVEVQANGRVAAREQVKFTVRN